jgi:hypothetical protein
VILQGKIKYFNMKKLEMLKLEKVQGGDWVWSSTTHAGCFLMGLGAAVGTGGIAGPAVYLGCLLVNYR